MNLQDKLINSFESENDLAIVIRTHIVIESYLRRLICTFLVDEKFFDKARLEYSQLVQLSLAFGLQPRFESSLKAIGKLRNDFAHNLRDTLNQSDVNNLYNSLSRNEKEHLQITTKKVAKQLNLKPNKHKDFATTQQFINIAVILASALHVACNQAVEYE